MDDHGRRARRAWTGLALGAGLLPLLVGCLTAPIRVDAGSEITRSFAPDLARRLTNPHRGWVAYARPEDPRAPADFDSVSVLIDWASLEPRAGVYAWAAFDETLARQARPSLSARLYLQPDPYWGLRGRPAWIDRRHPPVFCGDEDPGCAQGRVDWSHPPYWDADYRGRAARFLRAFAERYAGRLAYVDVRCYGIFGEWDADHHGAFPWAAVAPEGVTRRETLEAWVDVYARAFSGSGIRPVINLAAHRRVSDDHLDEIGLTRAIEQGFGLRYDAFRPQPPVPWARRTLARFGPDAFVVAEPGYRRSDPASGEAIPCGWCPEDAPAVLEEMLDAGATYASLGVEPRHWEAFVSGWQPLIARGARWLGYRLSIATVRGPARVRAGAPLRLEVGWRNDGIAPLAVPARLELTLVDRDGRGAWRGLDACEDFVVGRVTRGAARGEPAGRHTFAHCFALPASLAAGWYDMRLSLVDRDGRRIELGQATHDAGRRYPVGSLRVDR